MTTVSETIPDTTPEADAHATGDAPPLTLWTKLAYGVGAVAFGVKNNGFDYFLLIFYSQVVGLDAPLVGLAILIALLVDAVSDPIVGYWSDNLRSRWGRRHPFMYASAIPVAISFYMLWAPPADLSQAGLFWYVLTLSIVIRTSITFYETPSAALAPELTRDYDGRSTLIGYRFFFGWTGGNAMTVLMFFFLFPLFVTATLADGRFNPEAYTLYGLIGSALIFSTILISAIGTHARIVHFAPPPPVRKITLSRVFGEIFETLADRSFLALFIASLLGAIATGLAAALAFYFYTYFWGFGSVEMGMLMLGTFVAAVIGFTLAPVVTRTLGKKRGAMIIGIIAFLGAPLPIVLRLIGVLPDNGDPFLFWFVLITNIVDVGLIICFQILTTSMVADLVEQSEVKTGRRSEGVFTAAMTFIRKCVQGLGLMAATLVLTLAAFPTGAAVEDVSDDTLFKLGLYYVPLILTIWMAMMAVISTYNIDRATHEDNLKKLAAGKTAASS